MALCVLLIRFVAFETFDHSIQCDLSVILSICIHVSGESGGGAPPAVIDVVLSCLVLVYYR